MIFTGPVTFTGDITVHAVDPGQITTPILAALAANQGVLVTDFHAELGAALDSIVAALAATEADLSRELADFAAAVAPKLTPEEQQRLADIASRLLAADSSIVAADPTEPTP